MLATVVLPAQFLLEGVHCGGLAVWNVVQDVYRLDPAHKGVVDFVEVAVMGVSLQPAFRETSIDSLNVTKISNTIGPRSREDPLGCKVGPANYVGDPSFCRDLVEHASDGVVSGNLGIRNRCPQEGDLQIPELLPIQNNTVQVDLKLLQELLDICNRQFQSPSRCPYARREAAGQAFLQCRPRRCCPLPR